LIFSDNFIYIALLLVGGFFFFMQIKMMLFPQYKGEIIEFEDIIDKDCKACNRNKGKMSLPIKVKTDSGEIIEAEISCCTVCIEKFKVGSRVGVTKIGNRYITQACFNMRKNRLNEVNT
jgi:hypothetical protein